MAESTKEDCIGKCLMHTSPGFAAIGIKPQRPEKRGQKIVFIQILIVHRRNHYHHHLEFRRLFQEQSKCNVYCNWIELIKFSTHGTLYLRCVLHIDHFIKVLKFDRGHGRNF